MPPKLFELLQEDEPKWIEVLEASTSIEDAQYVDEETQLTPLHLAVQATNNLTSSTKESRIGAVRSLLESNLTSTEVKCASKGWTPLMYACVTVDLDSLEDNVPVIKLLMDYNPRAFHILTTQGRNPLEMHIMSISKLKQEKSTIGSMFVKHKGKGSKAADEALCTSILKVLTHYDIGGALAQSLEILLACNSLDIMEYVAEEEAQAFVIGLRERRKQHQNPEEVLTVPSVASKNLQQFWVWEFVITILRSEHHHTFGDVRPVPPFNALHTASQIPDFPLPFLMMCMRAYPSQVRTPSVVRADLPVHSVAGWDAHEHPKMARKSMALTQLLSEHPTSSNTCNEQGKTPVAIAIESGSSWKTGVRRLAMSQKQSSVVRRSTEI